MPTPHKTVDALVKAEADRSLRPVIEAVRDAMRTFAPKMEEFVGYSMPMWRGNGHVAFMSSMKQDVKLGFVAGLKLEDRYRLLKGKGKVTRHLIFTTVDDVKPTVMRYYIRQVAKLDHAEGGKKKPKAVKKAGPRSAAAKRPSREAAARKT